MENDDRFNALKIFVGGLSTRTTPESLADHFSRFGAVESAEVKMDARGVSRGFGFVLFRTAAGFDAALKCPEHRLDGRYVDPKLALPHHDGGDPSASSSSSSSSSVYLYTDAAGLPVRRIFVGGVSREATDADLKQYFLEFGIVEDACVIVDPKTGFNKGFGFVTMKTAEAADEVCRIHFHFVRGKQVECKKAYPSSVTAAVTTTTVTTTTTSMRPPFLVSGPRTSFPGDGFPPQPHAGWPGPGTRFWAPAGFDYPPPYLPRMPASPRPVMPRPTFVNPDFSSHSAGVRLFPPWLTAAPPPPPPPPPSPSPLVQRPEAPGNKCFGMTGDRAAPPLYRYTPYSTADSVSDAGGSAGFGSHFGRPDGNLPPLSDLRLSDASSPGVHGGPPSSEYTVPGLWSQKRVPGMH